MPQYGALGAAKDGKNYREILNRYFTGIRIGKAATREVSVLIATGLPQIRFTEAKLACGKNLNANNVYSFRLESGDVSLRRPNGSKLAGCGDEGSARGGASVVFSGVGVYRGDLRARSVGGSLYAINHVDLDSYVKGVVPNESFAGWPQAALRAQAVAARSYALATRVTGNGYDLYDDARSQVYSGKSSEQGSTNNAVEATKAEVVKSNGNTVAAYFFSSSGGRTENSEFGFIGGSPRPYLKSVRDPFDKGSPHHSWKLTFSQAQMEAELSGLFNGNLKKVDITKTGVSPRIVEARVVGSTGSSTVSGDTLRFRLGLRSNWARFEKR